MPKGSHIECGKNDIYTPMGLMDPAASLDCPPALWLLSRSPALH